MILLDRITKTYPGDSEPALDGVSLHIEPHEFVFLVGKSGAGKSTLIKMITKEENPDSGKIIIGGIDLDYVRKRHIPHYRRRLGVVFQDYKLLPRRTVFENVAFALEIAGMSNREINRTVPKVLDLVGLSGKAHKFPSQLSGGEQQRVGIARSVARQPKILIADEPTGNLDKLTRQEIIDLLQRINDFGTTVLVTTHDENVVNNLSKRVITLKSGQIVSDQKVHGVYRLDDAKVETQVEMEFEMPIAEPAMPVVQRLQVPGEKLVAMPQVVRMSDTEGSMKIQHPTHRKPVSAPKKVVSKTAPKAEAKVKEAPKMEAKAPSAKPAKTFAPGSANEWYAANRPLKAAPRLADFRLSQTVKLKPAPSMSQVGIKRPVVAPKIRNKRVI